MILTQDINYKNNLFENPKWKRIIGEPNTATFKTLQAEVHYNAQQVHSELGGRENVHLSLACTKEVHLVFVLNEEPYKQPANPGGLAIEEELTQYQIAQAWDEHRKAVSHERKLNGWQQ